MFLQKKPKTKKINFKWLKLQNQQTKGVNWKEMKSFSKECVVDLYQNLGERGVLFREKSQFLENVSNLKKIVHGVLVLQLI